MKRFLLYTLLLLFIASCPGVFAQTSESYDSKIDGVSFRVDSLCRTVDSIFNTPLYSSQITSTYLVRNSIILELVDNSSVVFPDSFSVDVNVGIYWTDSTNTVNTDYKTLRVEYNHRNLIQDTLRSFYGFSGGHIVTVKILAITAHNISTPLPDIIRLVNRMELYRDYFALCGDITVLHVDTSYITDQDELLVSWEDWTTYLNTNFNGNLLYSSADEYDLEWTFYDSESELYKVFDSTGVVPYSDDIFRNNCSRVTIRGTSYQIPLIYEKGILIYRIRAVRVIQNGTRLLGEWTTLGSGKMAYRVNGHEDRLNWQSKTSFAEEGKRKSVVSYFDGSSYSRQIVTKINTDTTAIVAETIYDWEGRPVVNTLPAPTISKLIKHFDLFNKDTRDSSYTWRDLDSNETGCNNPPKVMSISSGSSQYYSPQNPNVTSGFNQYIPNAFGYPFSQTAYTSDLTNRIRRSSGPGKDHKMGTEHVTTYYYGAPEQSELSRLFADEAGAKAHYFKNLVVDPNGQVSVTYQDMHGRTIATALAGFPSPLDSVRLDTIPDFRSDTILYDAILDTTNNLIDGTSIICTKTFTVASAGTYNFFYYLLPENIILNSCDSAHFCFDCVYDLKITVTDDCNNKKMPGNAAFVLTDSNYSFSGVLPYYFDTTCTNRPILDSFGLTLPVGEYTVTKVLSIKKEAIDFYFNYYLRKDTCLKTFDDFYKDALTDVDLESCQITCTECLSHLGTPDSFCHKFIMNLLAADSTRIIVKTDTLNAQFAYDELKHACDMLCDSFDICEHKRAMMLSDMSPGGQYALYQLDSLNEMFSSSDSTSIFFQNTGSIYGHLPLYSDSTIIYQNGTNGQPDTIVTDFNHDGVLDTLRPNSLPPTQFVQFWKPSWAEALLSYHPEYCYYQFCVANSASNQYDEWLRSISSYDTALYYGLMNPLNMPPDSCNQLANVSHQDPFFTSGGLGYAYNAQFKERLMRYYCFDSIDTIHGTHSYIARSIWDLSALLISCTDPSCTNCMKNYYWNAFRNMYLGVKKVEEDSIMKIWGHDNCAAHDPFSSGPQSSLSWFKGKDARFEIIDNNSAPLPLYSVDLASSMAKGDSVASQSEYFTCKDYTPYWWRQLSGCGIPHVDSALIINELMAVCEAGTDSLHPMGASSTRSGVLTSHGYKSFEDVLSHINAPGWTYYPSDSCTSLLITNPLPNSARPMYYQTAQIDRPSQCVCQKIANAHNAYALDTNYHSFSEYLNGVEHIWITEDDIQVLVKSCDSNNVCERLAHPVALPYQFSCDLVCANCYQIITAYNNFLHKFPGVYASPNYLALMQSSMNSDLGMNITAQEYFIFMADSCHYNNFPYKDTVACKGPIAVDDTVYTGYGQALNIGVVANDQTNGPVVINVIRHAVRGTEAISGGNVYYTPFAGYTSDQVDTMTYIECNDCNTISCDTAEVYVHISSVISHYSAPVTMPDTVIVCMDSVYSINPIANDINTDSSILHLSAAVLVADSTTGSVSTLLNNVFGIIHVAGEQTIAYSVCTDDPHPLCGSGFIHVMVNECSSGARKSHGAGVKISAKKSDLPILERQAIYSSHMEGPMSVSGVTGPAIHRNLSDVLASLSKLRQTEPASAKFVLPSIRKRLTISLAQRLNGGSDRVSRREQTKVTWNSIRSRNSHFLLSSNPHISRRHGTGVRLIKAGGLTSLNYKISNQTLRSVKIENLPYDEIFRNVGASGIAVNEKSRLLNKETRETIIFHRSHASSYFLKGRLTMIMAQPDFMKGDDSRSNKVFPRDVSMPSILLNSNTNPNNTPDAQSSTHFGRPGVGFGVSLSDFTGDVTWCDSLQTVVTDFTLAPVFQNPYEFVNFMEFNIGQVHSYLEWSQLMSDCGIACPDMVSCSSLANAMDSFYTRYPIYTSHVPGFLLTSYLNQSGIGYPNNLSTDDWLGVMHCCGLTPPHIDTMYTRCDSIAAVDSAYLSAGGLKPNGGMVGFFDEFLGSNHVDSLSGLSVPNNYNFWSDQLSTCGLGCPPIVSCDTLNAIINRFYTAYPAGHDSCPNDVLTAFLNENMWGTDPHFYMNYDQWSGVYSCCGISLPISDTTRSHCDSLVVIDYFLLQLPYTLHLDSCMPDYFWDYFINLEFNRPITIQQLNSELAGCGTFPMIDFCHDTLYSHCDSIRSLERALNFVINLNGGIDFTGELYSDLSLVYSMQFGVNKAPIEVIHEIATCDTGLCLVTDFAKFYLDSIYSNGETCLPKSVFTATMNSASGYHYTSEEWCARLVACGKTCPNLCADTIVWCDSLTAAYNYYIGHYGLNHPDSILPYFNGLWGDHHYEGAVSVENTLGHWFDLLDSCGLSCHPLVNCDTLQWAILRFDSIYPSRRDSCPAWVLDAYLRATFFPQSDGPDHDTWMTLLGCCGIPLPTIDTTSNSCDTLANLMFNLQAVNATLPDSCLPAYFWGFFISQLYPELGITSLDQLNAELSGCGSFPPLYVCDTMRSHCDSVMSITAVYDFVINFDGGDGQPHFQTFSDVYALLFGIDTTPVAVIHEIAACDSSSCFVPAVAVTMLDSMGLQFDSCMSAISFAAGMNAASGYHHSYSEWQTILSNCGDSIPLICGDTSHSSCDSVLAAMQVYFILSGLSIDHDLNFDWLEIAFSQYYGRPIAGHDAFTMIEVCFDGELCDNLSGIDSTLIIVANTYSPCIPAAALTGLFQYLTGGLPLSPSNLCTIMNHCGDSCISVCDEGPVTNCDSIQMVVTLWQHLVSVYPDMTMATLDTIAQGILHRDISYDSVQVLAAACDSSSCLVATHALTLLDSLGMRIDSCMSRISFVAGMNAASGYNHTYNEWQAILSQCGDSIPLICSDTSYSSCDSVLAALQVYFVLSGRTFDQDFNLPWLEVAFTSYYGRTVTGNDAFVMVTLCFDTAVCDNMGEIESALTQIANTYTPCMPSAAVSGFFQYLSGGLPLSSGNLCAIMNHCGDSCISVCDDGPMTSCDSIQMVITLWEHVLTIYPDIQPNELEGMAQWMLHTDISYDSILVLAAACGDTFSSDPCVAHDTVRSSINTFLAQNPGVQYADDYPDILYHYLDSTLAGYSASVGIYISGAKWCDMMRDCGDSCPAHLLSPSLCNRPLLPPVSAQYTDSCNMQMEDYAFSNASAAWGAYLNGLRDEFANKYVEKCLGAYRLDSFSYRHPNAEYHYTLYYYDQAGNLVKTIPPAGVDLYHQNHTMATSYRYNTQNQVIEQMTPDAGRSRMWYDRIGKVTWSQNSRQKPDGQYSYTLYDPLQRITEVGQWNNGSTDARYGEIDSVILHPDWYAALQAIGRTMTEVTRTYYDYDTLHIHDTLGIAEDQYLRNRVASTTYADVLDTGDIHHYQSASHYRYDIHGNVSTLLQENTRLRRIGQQWKQVNYDYDLISGKVNEVIYQPRKPDMMIHVYEYDADNRLTDVRTTRDSVVWDHDASYSYYKHGPLARMELGDAKVQAMNYVYTIQGWLKGVNGLDPDHNIGRDAESSGVNSIVAKSELGYALTYYRGDYEPISSIFATTLRPVEADYTNLDIRSLYNGNIALMQLNLPKVGQAQAYRYSYDQLNRITGMSAYNGLSQPSGTFSSFHAATWYNATALPDYAEKVNYDPNGNIAYYNRHGNSGTNIDMDSMIYRYLPGTNKLDHVDDAVAASNYSVDIDDQDTLNYRYDQIGNLTRDTSEGIDTILWTLYGKIQEIDKHNGDTIRFAYDPGGHRIMKEVYKDSTHHKRGTYYTHDATGNIMATYEWQDMDTFRLGEIMMYGSSRLGSIDVNLLLCDTVNNDSVTSASRSTGIPAGIAGVVYHTYGLKQYELSNHLGNVLATITDRHIPVYTGTPGSLNYYLADVSSAQDYYPFGMQMPGRIFQGQYRFGFNGKEQDDEIKGDGNSLNFGARIYDSRIARFLSIDPLTKNYPMLSSYLFAQNSPVAMTDKEGMHAEIIIAKTDEAKNAAIKKIDVNVLFLLSKNDEMSNTGDQGVKVYVDAQVRATFGQKTFEGSAAGKNYKASFNVSIMNGLKNDEVKNLYKSNPVSNLLLINLKNSSGKAIQTSASGRTVYYNTSQRQTLSYPFAHELSHILGEDGDMFGGKNNYMSTYNNDRQVQDQEVQDFLTPAIELANEFKGQNIVIHFFNSTDKDGKETNGSGQYNTYRVFDPATKKYLKSKTVPLINPKTPAK